MSTTFEIGWPSDPRRFFTENIQNFVSFIKEGSWPSYFMKMEKLLRDVTKQRSFHTSKSEQFREDINNILQEIENNPDYKEDINAINSLILDMNKDITKLNSLYDNTHKLNLFWANLKAEIACNEYKNYCEMLRDGIKCSDDEIKAHIISAINSIEDSIQDINSTNGELILIEAFDCYDKVETNYYLIMDKLNVIKNKINSLEQKKLLQIKLEQEIKDDENARVNFYKLLKKLVNKVDSME